MTLIQDLSAIGVVYPHFSGVVGKAIDEISRTHLNDDDREILSCMMKGWIESDMKIPGNISYQMVIDLMHRFGVDPTPIEHELEKFKK